MSDRGWAKTLLIGDASSLSYVAEHQENLKSVMIMLHGSGLSLKDDLYIETALSVQPGCGVKEAEILSRRDTSLSLKVELPVAVPVGQTVNLQQSDLHLEAKLSALPTQSAASFSALTSLAHPLSAPELRKLRPKALCCTMCDREVADLSKASRSEDAEEGSGFKDLPSEHWAEMLEVWMCHDDPAFTAKVARQTNEGFWSTRENVLVGGSYLLVHPEEAKSKNLQLEKENVSFSFRKHLLPTPSISLLPPYPSGYKKAGATHQLAALIPLSTDFSIVQGQKLWLVSSKNG